MFEYLKLYLLPLSTERLDKAMAITLVILISKVGRFPLDSDSL